MHQRIFYLWRPVLRDPKDEMVLEVAVAGQCEAIVTYNTADFAGAEQFGLRTMSPRKPLAESVPVAESLPPGGRSSC